VSFRAYEEYPAALRALPKGTRVVYDPEQVTQGSLGLLPDCLVLERRVPTFERKAIKTQAELTAMRQANLKASRAKIRALAWLDTQLAQKVAVSEASFSAKIEALYAEEADYRGQSFRTISAAGPNSAVVHYGKNSPEAMLSEGEYFLIDSGAQYLGGTTDDTRTISIGEVSEEHKRVYTSVLKAHLALGGQLFPAGTVGAQLDAATRAPLWRQRLSYGHGTGHGVGAYLNVHEGPQRIAWPVMEKLLPGMIVSNEPGAYREGWGGVRIENLVIVVERGQAEGLTWYGFENLTFVPYDRHLIQKKMLSADEIQAIDRYHADVRAIVGRTLSGHERDWLERACAAL
jgi:Xaa-Pro aminopeptidase